MIDIPLLIGIAEIKKQASRHGSMAQRWWQNRIYGLRFFEHGELIADTVRLAEAALLDPATGRARQNTLKGFLNGLRDASLAWSEDRARAREPGSLVSQTEMDGPAVQASKH